MKVKEMKGKESKGTFIINTLIYYSFPLMKIILKPKIFLCFKFFSVLAKLF